MSSAPAERRRVYRLVRTLTETYYYDPEAGRRLLAADRTVHAVTYDGCEIVRYDRGGKWFL